MKLTTKGHYAVALLLDLALYQKAGDTGQVSLREVSNRQDISVAYLEQLAGKLRLQGLIKSARGVNGGYKLARAPELISVANIINAIEEPINITKCNGAKNCRSGKMCLSHSLWGELSNVINDFLQQVTLAELIKKQGVTHIECEVQNITTQKCSVQYSAPSQQHDIQLPIKELV